MNSFFLSYLKAKVSRAAECSLIDCSFVDFLSLKRYVPRVIDVGTLSLQSCATPFFVIEELQEMKCEKWEQMSQVFVLCAREEMSLTLLA